AGPDADATPPGPALGRDAAQAAGTVVHRLLERLDLALAPAASLDAAQAELDELARAESEGLDAAAVTARARELWRRVASGALGGRRSAPGGTVLGRGPRVLLPPPAEPDAPAGFVAGAIDLLYRDPSGALVVADYKTDRVATRAEAETRAVAYRPQGAAYT